MNTNREGATPFAQGDGHQITTWQACIRFHQRLAQSFGAWLRLGEAGRSDGGVPIHVGVLSSDGVFDAQAVKAAGRPVSFNHNGIPRRARRHRSLHGAAA